MTEQLKSANGVTLEAVHLLNGSTIVGTMYVVKSVRRPEVFSNQNLALAEQLFESWVAS
jgi:hypothetical protein